MLFEAIKSGVKQFEIAFVLLPPEFIHNANSNPIVALASMAWIGSQIRDMVNGRLTIDQQNINARALATEAHFLHEATKRHPDIKLPDFYQELMQRYPLGIKSLPPGIWYKGVSGHKLRQAPLN